MEKISVAVCGASGFIGGHLASYLRETGDFNVTEVSLRSLSWRDEAGDADVIINLVGKAHDHEGKATEDDYRFANIELAQQVFKQFLKTKAKLLIHLSSLAAAEEIHREYPLTEDSPQQPVSIYGITKLEAEKWLLAQDLPAGKAVAILRPPMVHGAGDKGNLGLLYKLISKRIPYPLGAFKNQRSFISVRNLCAFIAGFARLQDQCPTGVYHVADDEPVSTTEIISLIGKVTGRKPLSLSIPRWLVTRIAKLGDSTRLPLNTTRLQKLTGTLIVVNTDAKETTGINKLPESAMDALENTLRSFTAAK